MTKINVDLNARLEPDGSVRCHLKVNGQRAIVTFTGTDILFDVPEGGQHHGAEEGVLTSPGEDDGALVPRL
jgi:hypothetical protein